MLKRFIVIGLSLILVISMLAGSVAVISASAEDGSAIAIPDASEVADEALEATVGLQHPYLMYETEDIPALIEKTKSGNSKKAYDVIVTTAKTCMNLSFNVTGSSSGIIGRQLQYSVMYLSTYAALTGDTSYATKAVSQVVSAANKGNVEIYLSINDALSISDFGTAYALAYDTLYNYMTPAERTLIRTEMEEIGEWIFVNSPEINTWGADTDNRKAWNWNAVTHGALGLISLSLGDHADWLTLAIDRTQGYYQHAVDATGAAMEGLHYVGYALNTLAPLDYAVYRLSGTELLDAFPAFQNVSYWSMLYMTVPYGGKAVAINQGDGVGNYSGPYYIINRYSQADALWAWEYTYSLQGDGQFNVEYQGNGWSAPAIIFFEDQELVPEKPTEENNPLIATFEKGLVVARDSWESDASMLTFTCGRGQSGCWNHPDDNSFTFHARGASYIVDLGANAKYSSQHNVVLIDGVGMDYDGGSTMRVGEILENRLLENGNLYLSGSNTTSYNKQKLGASLRQIVYGDGEVPFVLVYDHVRKDSNTHDFSVNFFTGGGVTAKVEEDGYATLTSAAGEICYVIPYSTDGVTIEATTVHSSPCLTTTTTARFMRQFTLFIMAESDGSMPEVTFETEGKNTTVTITRTVNGQLETETYQFAMEELLSFSTTEELPVEDIPTEETSEEKVEETTEEKVTEPVINTEKESVATTAPEIDYDETESKTEASDPTGAGCGSAIGISAIPATAIGAAFMLGRKKKKHK